MMKTATNRAAAKGPKGRRNKAGGEAKRNHRDGYTKKIKPRRGGGIYARNLSVAPPGLDRIVMLFRWFRFASPPAPFRPPSGRQTRTRVAHWLPITRLPTTDYRLPITDYRLPITDYRLPITDYRLPIADYRLPITDYPLTR